jgi:transglutaminase-like putative cysteine protease
MIGGLGAGRALLWVVVAVAAAVAVLATERIPGSRARALALLGVVAAAMVGGYALSGAGLDLLKPRHWDELASGLAGGMQALGTVRLPYVSADPWPRIVLELMGAELLIAAGLLTFWPRIAPATGVRTPLAVPDRGYPFIVVGVLILVVASPVVSLGGTGSLMLGLALAALSVCFLWLERLPLRPGYRAFAESLGPDDPVRFSWRQSYGPMDWPRNGNEVMRVTSREPLYWKARNLDVFDKWGWTVRTDRPEIPPGKYAWEVDVPEDWENRPQWTSEVEFSIRRVRTADVYGAGTIIAVRDASRAVQEGVSPGTWDAPSGLRRGDSYGVQVHVPKPGAEALETATSGERELQDDMRVVNVPFKPGERAPLSIIGSPNPNPDPLREAEVHFGAWGSDRESFADYPRADRSEFDIDAVMARSEYERTWELAKRLKRGAEHPMDYIRAVDEYLRRPEFRYAERPAQAPFGRAPLDFFLNESHEGYCQHFAGAMALLLRMGGLPARVATGFSPGGYSSRHEAWIVRDPDAHAWVEVWFDGFGWITLDPTPPATPARSLIAALAAPPSSAPITPDSGGSGTTDTGGDDSNVSVRPDLLAGGAPADAAGGGAGQSAVVTWLIRAGAALLIVALVLAVLVFLRRPRGDTPLDRAIAELENALRRVGRPVTTGTTLGQLEERFGSHSPEVRQYLRSLATGRYGPVPASPTRAGRRAMRRALAQGLGFGGGLRALWAMPPRFERAPRSRVLEVDASVRR